MSFSAIVRVNGKSSISCGHKHARRRAARAGGGGGPWHARHYTTNSPCGRTRAGRSICLLSPSRSAAPPLRRSLARSRVPLPPPRDPPNLMTPPATGQSPSLITSAETSWYHCAVWGSRESKYDGGVRPPLPFAARKETERTPSSAPAPAVAVKSAPPEVWGQTAAGLCTAAALAR